ncbi:hypothetical protein K2173_023869 [Erythroxylum novogranatense]|uniref:PXMP2/4 family protein 4 n=1 Tax=Erythroxylum novogranatense TaxID=1862640 RepID=A0AAV8TS43_9ROSI|nr:hypothetical protein K2173_023869 [Erythroxylum novogranatense]
MNAFLFRKSAVLRQMVTHITAPTTVRSTIGHQVSNTPTPYRGYYGFPNIFRSIKECNGLSRPSIFTSTFSSSSSSSSSTATASVSKVGLVAWYLGKVKSRPILTKSITSSIIYVAADLSSQMIVLPVSEPYDLVRTARMGGYGLIVLGPALHFWFNFVSKILPQKDLITTFKKMAMGQTIFGPAMTVLFFSLNAFLQGENGAEIVGRLKRDLLPTMLNGVMYWPVCDFITFRFFPVHLQPLVSNSFSYIWTIYMTYMASLERVGATS